MAEYKVQDVNVKTIMGEGDRATVDAKLVSSLDDLKNRLLDPTVEAINLTAVVRNGDDSITLADLCLSHNHQSKESAVTYMVTDWQHKVPESVYELYDELASNLDVYIDNEPVVDGEPAITRIAVGDPSNEHELVVGDGLKRTADFADDMSEYCDNEESDSDDE